MNSELFAKIQPYKNALGYYNTPKMRRELAGQGDYEMLGAFFAFDEEGIAPDNIEDKYPEIALAEELNRQRDLEVKVEKQAKLEADTAAALIAHEERYAKGFELYRAEQVGDTEYATWLKGVIADNGLTYQYLTNRSFIVLIEAGYINEGVTEEASETGFEHGITHTEYTEKYKAYFNNKYGR